MRITNPLRAQISANGFRLFAIQRNLGALNGSTDGLDCGAYGRYIQHCTDRRLLRQGLQLHARLVLFSVVPDNFLASKLIAFYAKSRRLDIAREVFDKIPHKNAFSWNAMMIAFSVQGLHRDVLSLFSSMSSDGTSDVRADNFTVTCVLKSVTELFSGPSMAKEVHCYVLRTGFLDSDVFVGNSLVTCYARGGEVGLARALFDRMPSRDTVSWNSMLAAYSQAGFYNECKALYREMLGSAEERPNDKTMVSVLQACALSKDLELGKEVHRYMIENGIHSEIILHNALVGLYAKCGSLDYALELFDWMDKRDEVTYASMISGFMAHGLVKDAMDFFYGICNPGTVTWNSVMTGLVQNGKHKKAISLLPAMMVHGNRPNFITLSNVLTAVSISSNLRGVREVHAYAYRNAHERNAYVSSALIDAYGKSGLLHAAHSVFELSKESKNPVVWTAMISAHGAHGAAHAALRIFREMVQSRIPPERVTFLAVLTSCAHFGVVDEAKKIFDSMVPVYGVNPEVEHYTCMVTVLSRAGRLAEAVDFIKRMPGEACAKAWGALLSGAAVVGDVEMGALAFERLSKIEPLNSGNYVIMANLYSQADKFKEADSVREMMNGIGLKKVAGSSWIETSDASLALYTK